MFSVENSLPVQNYSTKVISDQAGSVFDPVNNSRIRLNVPSSMSMVDLRNSYVQFELALKAPAGAGTSAAAGNNTYIMELSNGQGVEQLFRNFRVYLDNKEVENIAHANTLEQFVAAYTEDVSLKGVDSTFSHNEFGGNNPSFFQTTADVTAGTMNINTSPTKQIYKPKCSGIWNYPNGLPLLLTGDMTLEWELEESARVLTPKGKLAATMTSPVSGANITNVVIPPANVVGRGWGSTTAEVTERCPYAQGNIIQITGTVNGAAFAANREITGVTVDMGAAGITLTVAPYDTSAGAVTGTWTATSLFGKSSVDGGGNAVDDTNFYTYEVSKVELVTRVIELPPQYVQAATRRVNSEGFAMDIQSWTNYINNVLTNVSTQSVLIPNYNQRVKSVLSIPVNATQTDYQYDRKGQLANLKNYQCVIGQRREPQRPVDLQNTSNTTNKYPSQEHLHELVKALSASGKDVRTLRHFRENFALCRSLSYDGSSESLAEKGIRFEFEHLSSVVTAKVLYSYVYSIRRIQVTAQEGLQVLM
jgi:hypothetical protein